MGSIVSTDRQTKVLGTDIGTVLMWQTTRRTQEMPRGGGPSSPIACTCLLHGGLIPQSSKTLIAYRVKYQKATKKHITVTHGAPKHPPSPRRVPAASAYHSRECLRRPDSPTHGPLKAPDRATLTHTVVTPWSSKALLYNEFEDKKATSVPTRNPQRPPRKAASTVVPRPFNSHECLRQANRPTH